MRFLVHHWRKAAIATLFPVSPPHDIVTKDSKTGRAFDPDRITSETGWDRLKLMFNFDEFGRVSSEINSVYQAGFLGFLVGAIYGGFINSRVAYMNFMESNEATAFKSHLDAKRKLQDQVTISFAKGGFRWGWRVSLFTSSYVAITTCISVYRGKSSIYEYVAAGTLTGAVYKMNLGLRGVAVGGLLGCILGGVAGGASLFILRATGTTMEEVRYWQYRWKKDRDEAFNEGLKKAEEIPPLMQEHDEKASDVKEGLKKIE